MKRFLTLALIGAVMLGAGSVAYANVCAFDPVPAATLLFPFVTYNYGLGASGYNTLFAVTNVSEEATIAHVTVWTDFSVPILDFNILLTGYDVQTLSIRDILANGQLPVTTIGAHTQTEGVFEDGPVSGANTYAAFDPPDLPNPQATTVLNTAGRCTTSATGYPGRYTTPIPANILALFEGWLKSSQTVPRYHDNCGWTNPANANPYVPSPVPWFEGRTEDDDTWMYITVDVVETCNLFFPDDQEYWVNGELRYDNILMGDVIYVNQTARLSEAENAVQIEAAASVEFEATPIPGTPYWASFYARYGSFGYGFFDYREPLPTAWAFRYLQDDGLGLTTGIRAWKGGITTSFVPDLFLDDYDESPNEMWALNCLAYTYYVWDENENVTSTATNPWSQPGGESVILNVLPLETQEVMADQFNILDAYGWFLFVWPNSNFAGPGVGGDWYQTWMGVQYTKAGEYSAFRTGHVMANYNCFEDQVLPQLGILYQPPVEF